ncbi:MAG: InlB B-repeat-containing protein, partial [Bifidobacteriaceae bacterium]|nr:InlB B-repeat-containing protein [Bifidobacteriaceae bacterium]
MAETHLSTPSDRPGQAAPAGQAGAQGRPGGGPARRAARTRRRPAAHRRADAPRPGLAALLGGGWSPAAPARAAARAGLALVRALRALLTGAGARRWVVAAAVAAVAIPLVVAPPSRADEPGGPGQPGAPALTAGTGERTDQRAGTVGFESTEDGTYHYLVYETDEAPPTADEVLESGSTGPMAAGPNVLELSLRTSAAFTVWVVGTDLEGNDSNLVSIDLEPGVTFTVTHSPGGSASVELVHTTGSARVKVTATPDAGWAVQCFWDIEPDRDPHCKWGGPLDDFEISGVVSYTGIQHIHRHISFTKEVPVEFHLGAPVDAPDWSAGAVTAWIGAAVPAPPDAPDLDGYRFVGWYPSKQALDAADPDQAWQFSKNEWDLEDPMEAFWSGVDVVDHSMVDAEGTVHLYGAWASTHGEIAYDVNAPVDCPVYPDRVGPDRVEIGSRLADAPSYGVEPASELHHAGCYFTGWAFDADGLEPVTADSTLDSTAVVLYGQWEPPGTWELREYLVGHGEDPVLVNTVVETGRVGDEVWLLRMFRPGYWFDDDRSNRLGTITKDPMLVLNFYYNAVPVEVAFDLDGGTLEAESPEVWYDRLLEDPGVPTKEGYAFLGWWSSEVGPWDFESDKLTVDNGVIVNHFAPEAWLTLTARWAVPPTAVGGEEAMIGVGGTAEMDGQVTPGDAGIVSAQVTGEPSWADAVAAGLDGTVELDADGLAPGLYEFTVRYTDANGLSVDADFAVTVVAGPVVSGGTYARIAEGGTAEFELSVTSGAGIASAVPSGAPYGATVRAGVDGKVVFEAGPGLAWSYKFTVTFTDKLGQRKPVVFTVVVQPAPSTPDAWMYMEVEDDLTPRDWDPFWDVTYGSNLRALTAESFTADQGSLEVLDSGLVRYTPKVGWAGEDPVTVTVCDGFGQCAALYYVFDVRRVYTPPEQVDAQGASASVAVGGTATLEGSVRVDLDHDVSVTSAQVSVEEWRADSVIEAHLDGQVDFEAGSLAPGEYTFTVTFTDSEGSTDDAVYTVTVIAPPAVTGLAEAKIGLGGEALFRLSVTTDDQIAGASPVPGSVPDGAAATVAEDGKVTFEAGTLGAGSHTFAAVWTDSLGQQSDAVWFSVVVQAPPVAESGLEAPVALGGRVSFAESVTTGGVIASRAVTAAPAAGRVELGSVVFHAESAAPGRYPFEVTYTDDVGQAAAATYTAVVLA